MQQSKRDSNKQNIFRFPIFLNTAILCYEVSERLEPFNILLFYILCTRFYNLQYVTEVLCSIGIALKTINV